MLITFARPSIHRGSGWASQTSRLDFASSAATVGREDKLDSSDFTCKPWHAACVFSTCALQMSHGLKRSGIPHNAFGKCLDCNRVLTAWFSPPSDSGNARNKTQNEKPDCNRPQLATAWLGKCIRPPCGPQLPLSVRTQWFRRWLKLCVASTYGRLAGPDGLPREFWTNK